MQVTRTNLWTKAVVTLSEHLLQIFSTLPATNPTSGGFLWGEGNRLNGLESY